MRGLRKIYSRKIYVKYGTAVKIYVKYGRTKRKCKSGGVEKHRRVQRKLKVEEHGPWCSEVGLGQD